MPMSFRTTDDLRVVAEVWKFQPPLEGESEAAYRAALAEPPISPNLAG